MRAVQVSRNGGPDVLKVADVDDPVPGPGEVLVEVAAAGVNYIDTHHRTGHYQVPTPFIPGIEGAGRVAALGDGVSDVAVGDRIAWTECFGSYAEKITVPLARSVPVPGDVTDEQAAGVLGQGLTALVLVTEVYSNIAQESVLVHAAAGGVGLLLTQLAAARGARVIATVSNAAKEKLARQAGAAEVIRYTEVDDLAGEVRALTGGEGVVAAYDNVGASTFDSSLASLRPRGTVVLYGETSGPVPPVDPERLRGGGSLTLIYPSVFDYLTTSENLRERAAALFRLVADGSLNVMIDQRYPLESAKIAHENLHARRSVGKALLIP
jgi:NADPH:quinone reductase